jgi:hypothetical protein
MSQVELVSVKFIGSASPYHAGDQAGFVAAEAKALVDKGVAEYAEPVAPVRVTRKVRVFVEPVAGEAEAPKGEQAELAADAPAAGEGAADTEQAAQTPAE